MSLTHTPYLSAANMTEMLRHFDKCTDCIVV